MANKVANSDMLTSDVTEYRFDVSSPPVFIMCGRFIGHEGWVHLSRTIDNWELVYVVEGTVFLQEEDRKHTVEKGDLLVLGPGRMHGGWKPSREGTSFIWVHMLPVIPPHGQAALGIPKGVFRPDSRHLRVILQQLLDAQVRGPLSEMTCRYLCGLILLELSNQNHGSQTAGTTGFRGLGWFEHLLDWIRLKSNESISVGRLASEAGKTTDHINRVFRSQLGMSALAYIQQAKMDKARELLMTTNLGIKTIAWNLGYQDPRQFLRVFRKRTLMTPTEFRNSYTRTHLNST